jgi:hypothetical protein
VFTGRRKSKSGAGAGYDLPCAGGEGIRARWLNLARGGGRRCRVRRGGGGGEETGTREGGGNGGGGGLSLCCADAGEHTVGLDPVRARGGSAQGAWVEGTTRSGTRGPGHAVRVP